MTDLKDIKNRRLLIFLLITFTIVPCVFAGENLLTNPDFERGNTAGWTNWGCNLAAVRSQSHTGDYSLLASRRTQTWQGPIQSLLGLLEDGRAYNISGWIRLQNASSDDIGLTIHQKDSSGTQYHAVQWTTAYNDRWVQLSGEFTPDITGSLSSFNMYFEGPAVGVSFYLDDAEVSLIEPPEPYAVGVVDINTVYQELEGFGASVAWYENWLTAHPKRDEIYDVLFRQLGLDIYRIRNTYDISSSYISRTATILQAAESSLGHPIKVMVSSWSPPAYLKSNGSTVRGTLKKDAGGNYMYEEFARWWADSIEEFSSYGIDVNYVNIQNEPDYLGDWDTCKLTPYETSSWAGYNLAFEAVYQELNLRMPGDMPKLLAAEACGCGSSKSYIDALIEPDHVYGYAHHLYADGSHDTPDGYIPAMENFASQYGDKPLLQTEFAQGESETLTFDDAMNLALLMHNSLVVEGVSAYLYWELFWGEPKGLVGLENPWGSNPGYTINPTYYAFGHYSTFTDPGWYRVEASTDSDGLRISAFKNPDDTELTIVIINTSDIAIDLSLSLGDFSPADSEIYRTNGRDYAVYIGTFDSSQLLSLGSQTIITIHLTAATQEIDEQIFESNP